MNKSKVTAEDAAKTERSVRRVWIKCTEAEETNRMLKRLVVTKVGTNAIEAYSHSKVGWDKWVNRGEEGRKQVVLDQLQSRVLYSNCKVKKFKSERKVLTNKFKNQVSHNVFRRKISKILSTCKIKRNNARGRHDDKVKLMKKKYGGEVDNFVVP